MSGVITGPVDFMKSGGVLMWPLLLISIAILVLAVINTFRLLRRDGGRPEVRSSVGSILFWGAVAAVLGFLGQWVGTYKVGQYILGKNLINPGAIMAGFGESLVTVVTGLTILIVAAVVWYVLHLRWSQLSRKAEAG